MIIGRFIEHWPIAWRYSAHLMRLQRCTCAADLSRCILLPNGRNQIAIKQNINIR